MLETLIFISLDALKSMHNMQPLAYIYLKPFRAEISSLIAWPYNK